MAAIDPVTLSPPERLALIGELWDSLADADVVLTQAQHAELERRLANLDAERDAAVPWADVHTALLQRLR